MNRWSTIQLATNKFCGCFAQVERLNRSGSTEKDKVLLQFNFVPIMNIYYSLRDSDYSLIYFSDSGCEKIVQRLVSLELSL